MYTIVESPLFSRLWPDYWSAEEYAEFSVYLSDNPEAGEVIPESGGCRKIRWSRQGMGKRGGVRVIYFNQLADGRIVLMLIYAKSAQDNISAAVLRQIAKEL
ncbi:MAG: type II toxin-antitoxin system RelE/ParE family toxin [Xanthomonadales bacterium]|nr:type II toxin-antitoxin system RelE/ParE family toxin [Xanthomonadales bacterium]